MNRIFGSVAGGFGVVGMALIRAGELGGAGDDTAGVMAVGGVRRETETRSSRRGEEGREE